MNPIKSITILFHLDGTSPYGGYKIPYEYANRLCADGHDVHIVYPALRFIIRKSIWLSIRMSIKYLYYRFIKGYSCRTWFQLDRRIKEHYIYSLDYKYVPKTDLYFATAVETALFLNTYPVPNQNKFYLIQGFENWTLSDERVKETYRYGFKNIVVSSWLEKIVIESGAACTLIKNGFDFEYFKMFVPICAKDRLHIAMMYSNNTLKGCTYGINALKIVKEKYPTLCVNLFGADPYPGDLPDYIKYYHRPNQATHNQLYNEAAIYLAPSINEGFGLTVGEAMICGCAVVCTDNKGFKEMAEDGVTALLSPVRNSQSLADNIIRLIEDDDLRIRIATQGNANIQQFRWEKSYAKLRALL